MATIVHIRQGVVQSGEMGVEFFMFAALYKLPTAPVFLRRILEPLLGRVE